MKDRIFSDAVTKLTLVYTTILAIICVGFSAAFYLSANQELNRPIHFRSESIEQRNPLFDSPNEFRILIEQRNEQMRANLLATLFFINLGVLSLGACASYFLARWTLQPIEKMTEQQANFISDASHELRTPLTALAMENEVALLDSSLSKAELTNVIKSNLEETHKLQDLTDRLLRLSQSEPLELSQVNLALSVKSATSNLSAIARAKHITIKNLVKPTKVTSNTQALTDILTILIENAIKYSPPESIVTVSFAGNKLSVRDQGPGIAATDLPHIFDRFYRAEPSRTSPGYGLGLPLAKQLAKELHLKITVETTSPKGTTFTLEPLT